MKKQSSKKAMTYTNVVSFLVALPLCLIIWMIMKVLWPLTKIITKFAFKLLRKGLTRSKFAKQKTQFPTPEIFKDSPNLAPAKPVRF